MRKTFLIVLCFILASFALAQSFDPVGRIEEARQRAAAVRAARVDALRQLGESIKGVKINSKTLVKDFVTESDEITAQFEGFLQGAQQEGNPNIYEDGTVEVKMVMYLNEVVAGLQELNKNNPSSKVSPNDFNKMQNYAGRKFEAIGTGAMAVNPSPPSNVDLWTYVTPPGRLMARRAAQMDAYRNIGETLYGLQLDSDTKVENFVCESDQIKAAFMGVVRGVSFEAEAVYRPDGLVEVVAFITVETFINSLSQISQQYYRGNDPTYQPRTFGDVRHYFPNDVIRATGVGAPPSRYIMGSPRYPSIANDNPFNRIPENYTPGNTTPTTNPEPPIIVTPPTPKAPAPPAFPGLSLNQPTRPQLPPLPRPPERFVPEWAKKDITATGTGAYREDLNVGQARAMARRAAQLDAYRLLSENALGVQLDSETTVEDFIASSDKITARVKECFIRGAQEVDRRDFFDERYFEVDMKLFLGDMWEIIDAEYNKNLVGKYGKKLEDYQPDQLRFKAEIEGYKSEIQTYTNQYQQYTQQLQQYNTQYSGQISPEYQQQCQQWKEQAQKAMTTAQQYQQNSQSYMSEIQQYETQYKNFYAQYQNQYNAYN
jgi:gas vesicle protein